jgi:hypothetical protein
MAYHKWTSCEKAAHLLAVLQGQAADIQHNVTGGTTCDIVRVLKGRYRDYQLAAVYRAKVKAVIQLSGESR